MSAEALQDMIDQRVLVLDDVVGALGTFPDGMPAYISLGRMDDLRVKPRDYVPALILRMGIFSGEIARMGAWYFGIYDHPASDSKCVLNIAADVKKGFGEYTFPRFPGSEWSPGTAKCTFTTDFFWDPYWKCRFITLNYSVYNAHVVADIGRMQP